LLLVVTLLLRVLGRSLLLICLLVLLVALLRPLLGILIVGLHSLFLSGELCLGILLVRTDRSSSLFLNTASTCHELIIVKCLFFRCFWWCLRSPLPNSAWLSTHKRGVIEFLFFRLFRRRINFGCWLLVLIRLIIVLVVIRVIGGVGLSFIPNPLVIVIVVTEFIPSWVPILILILVVLLVVIVLVVPSLIVTILILIICVPT
jgi:hypothetical protein